MCMYYANKSNFVLCTLLLSLYGKKCYCAVTQFEPTNARRCFPCWDEPSIKSIFEVTLIAPKGNVALSNMVWKFLFTLFILFNGKD